MAFSDEDLREAASHRGLKLVKSRKRKPGVGDYGLFGLADAAGKPLFGMDGGALTATAQQIGDYLRKGEVSTWAQSAKITPSRPKWEAAAEPQSRDADTDIPSAIRPRRQATSRAASRRDKSSPARQERADKPKQPRDDTAAPKPRRAPKPEPELEPKPEAELAMRTARPADADALHALLAAGGVETTIAEIKRRLAAATTRKEPVLVADRAGVVGCLAWHLIPTLDRGAVARITTIIVAQDHRRQGIGRALYAAALVQFAEREANVVETMSDIEVRNANGFLRTLGFKQASYRFVTEV